MESRRGDIDWKLGRSWALANLLGWGISVSSAIYVTDLVNGRNGELWIIPAALLIGLAQWLVLGRHFSFPGWLIPAYGLGWYIGLWLGWNLGLMAPEPFSLGAAGGTLVGAIQWLGMRRLLCRSWIWIPTMAISSLLGCWIGVLAGSSAYDSASIGMVLAYAIGGAVAGAVMGVLSGIVLVILIRQTAHRKVGITNGVST